MIVRKLEILTFGVLSHREGGTSRPATPGGATARHITEDESQEMHLGA